MPALYPFQQEAVDKFAKVQNILVGFDMGLGKTPLAIELDKVRRKTMLPTPLEVWLGNSYRQTLVVTKKSIIPSWEEHFKEWNPLLRVVTIDPKNRTSFVTAARGGSADVFVCHWEVLRLMPELQRIRWLHKIGDECQAIKNRKAQVTQAYKKIQAAFKTDMSGTWADNQPDDAWSILNHLYPKTWSSYWAFYRHHVVYRDHPADFCIYCEKTHKTRFREVMGVADEAGLHRMMARFYVRRTKEEVLKDLPEKYHTKVYIDLDPKQRRAYNDMRDEMLAWVGENEDQPLAAPIVIAKLTRLQQFAVAHGEMVHVKKKSIVPVPEGWIERHPDVSFKVDKEGQHLIERVENVSLLKLTEPSSKLDAVMDIIESTRGPVVVFSVSKQAINLLGARLAKANISHGLLTGDTSIDMRRRIIDDFQSGRLRVFAGTISAGGVGITLTSSSTVVFLDRAWSPSANRQAEDRLHRIGQQNAVQVIDLVARDTIDSNRLSRIELKWTNIRKILGG
jgi:SNF2 family DNA or RNA helicase